MVITKELFQAAILEANRGRKPGDSHEVTAAAAAVIMAGWQKLANEVVGLRVARKAMEDAQREKLKQNDAAVAEVQRRCPHPYRALRSGCGYDDGYHECDVCGAHLERSDRLRDCGGYDG
jgi:hypothetical protein